MHIPTAMEMPTGGILCGYGLQPLKLWAEINLSSHKFLFFSVYLIAEIWVVMIQATKEAYFSDSQIQILGI